MSVQRSATGRAWMAFLLAAILAVTGYAAFTGGSTASAQESPPVPTVMPQDDTSSGEAVIPATDEGEADGVIIEPTPDEAAQEGDRSAEEISDDASDEGLIAPVPDTGEGDGLIAPAPDEGAQERERTDGDTPEEASDADIVIAPAEGQAGEEGLIAPAPGGESGDGGTPIWAYGLAGLAALAAVGGAAGLARLSRRQRA
jgi:hypothetical protein